mmetsp:Transcript_15152/g.34796  ORF Transcript_15152/g.34796 Transcript_15152/m.34796 type:complete len:261 (+) Transcript_15152:623-1405(+)
MFSSLSPAAAAIALGGIFSLGACRSTTSITSAAVSSSGFASRSRPRDAARTATACAAFNHMPLSFSSMHSAPMRRSSSGTGTTVGDASVFCRATTCTHAVNCLLSTRPFVILHSSAGSVTMSNLSIERWRLASAMPISGQPLRSLMADRCIRTASLTIKFGRPPNFSPASLRNRSTFCALPPFFGVWPFRTGVAGCSSACSCCAGRWDSGCCIPQMHVASPRSKSNVKVRPPQSGHSAVAINCTQGKNQEAVTSIVRNGG